MQNTYDFCPKCGALVRKGVCTSCGTDYRNAFEQQEEKHENQNNSSDNQVSDNVTNQQQYDTANQQQYGAANQQQYGAANQQQYGAANQQQYGAANQQQYGTANQPYDSANYYGGQPPIGYTPTQKPKSNKVLIGIIIATVLVVIALVCYIGAQLGKLSKEKFTGDWKSAIEDSFTEEDSYSGKDEMDSEEDEEFWSEYEKENSQQQDENFTEERENYDASEITGPYYEEFVNCIDESVSYKVNREFYEKVEPEEGVSIQISYIQLEGDIPNLEQINEKIKEKSMEYAELYLNDEETYKELYEEQGYNHQIIVESYVTYNDEEMISIALDEQYGISGYTNLVSLKGININVKTGTVLDNTEMLEIDEEFIEEFCRRSNGQNGKNSIAIEQISNEEKKQLFTEEESLILFYTPIGLEVGYNYSGVEGYNGWITISLADYEQYLKGL